MESRRRSGLSGLGLRFVRMGGGDRLVDRLTQIRLESRLRTGRAMLQKQAYMSVVTRQHMINRSLWPKPYNPIHQIREDAPHGRETD